ncbi:gamma-glutamyl-gamma-aminobutyrate hydrolase family protein [Ktedonospora formicarum]|uniref:WD40 repeat domain-containing protein n=1 Tax=Ktedonospora formicarum TaxID=2778364 RepID=A0A8J3MWI6_9CHLR|nr:gamma-glutamyl-gamma-aminobutyrate hydrolase family protein [Ktedonospora formicarum]GHO47630.1 hypothetical protein KSX_57930 [Ktedonospora formicarum]
MGQRQLIIEQASRYRKRLPFQVRVHVDDQTPIGSWVMTLAGHLHYPPVDSFGAPIIYRLRCVSRKGLLLTSGRFADVEFPSGSHFVLEPETYHTEEMPAATLDQHHSTPQADSTLRLSRRWIMRSCMLAGVSLFGLGSGVTTAFAQRLLTQKVSLPTHKQLTPAPFGISAQAIFTQHQQTVKALTWSPDEQMLASGGNDHLTLVWQLDGTLLRTHMLDAHVRALAWSPDGLQLVAGASTTVTFFDAHTGTQLARDTEHHTDVVTALGWVQGPSGLLHIVSAGADKKAIVWNGRSHQPERTFRRHTAAIEALATLQDTVVTASQGGVARVWNATSEQEIHGYYFDTLQTLRAVAFSSGGTLATGSMDGLLLPASTQGAHWSTHWHQRENRPGPQIWSLTWEMALMQLATFIGMPILAIADGAKKWNVALGGTIQEVPASASPPEPTTPENWERHMIRVRSQIRLASYLQPAVRAQEGEPEPWKLSFMPHQAIETVAPPVRSPMQPQSPPSSALMPPSDWAYSVAWTGG